MEFLLSVMIVRIPFNELSGHQSRSDNTIILIKFVAQEEKKHQLPQDMLDFGKEHVEYSLALFSCFPSLFCSFSVFVRGICTVTTCLP